MKYISSFSRRAHLCVMCLLLVAAFLCRGQTAWAEGESGAVLTASAAVVHSGAPLTLQVRLASPAADEMTLTINGGSEPLSVRIPAGESEASVQVNAGSYAKTATETYTLGTDGGASVRVTVLPNPVFSFSANFLMVTAGKMLTVNVSCKNAAELTTALPVTLRTADGTVLTEFSFDKKHKTARHRFSVSKDWNFPYSLTLYNELTGKPCGRIPVAVMDKNRQGIRKVDTTEKKIAISFDCGFNNTYTDYILKTLDEYDAKATFFVTGEFITNFAPMLKVIQDKGHEIGNHSMTHPRLNQLEVTDIYKEINTVNELVYENTGTRPTLLRPPYGAGSTEVTAISRMLGCELIYWTIDTDDWDPKCSAEKIIGRATNGMGEGCIILFHNSAPKTEQTLRVILDDYKAKGLQIVSISELLYSEHYTVDENGLQQPDPNYTKVSAADLFPDYRVPVTVNGGESSSIELKAVFSDTPGYKKKSDVDAIKADPSLMTVNLDYGDSIHPPIQAGDKVGTATFSYGDTVWFTADLISLSAVAEEQTIEVPVIETPEVRPKSESNRNPTVISLAASSVILLVSFIVLLVMRRKKRAS